MSVDQLASHKRMRACLVGILDLDPAGVGRRIEEIDREIAYLEALLGPGAARAEVSCAAAGADLPLGSGVKAA